MSAATDLLSMSSSLLGEVVVRASVLHNVQNLDRAYLPVIGLLTSLCLQVTLLLTGELRKWNGSASIPGWLAYVLSDMVAAYLLGMLSRTSVRADLNGLWSAFLIFHLGGPDNFTAYERADSELWFRHLLNLVLQVCTASYIIGINTRGWILLPTLVVFCVGVERYLERNLALRSSCRQGLNKQVKHIFPYMEVESRFGARENMLEYVLAGAKHTARARTRSEISLTDFVATADVEQELEFSSAEMTRWAMWLAVASASSKAYLRRFIGLARAEQFSHRVRMRTIWFEQRLSVEEWMHYMEIEQGFLYGSLYTKPTDPERHLVLLLFRVLESSALVAALVLVYIYAKQETWIDRRSYKVVTYVLLLIGLVVEIAYVMRLLFSKGAAVAMLVALVRTQRAARRCSPWVRPFCNFRVRVTRMACASALHVSLFMDPLCHKNRQYCPRSTALSRVHRVLTPPLKLLGLSATHSQRGWDMFCLTLPKGASHKEEIEKVQAGQADALKDILELLLLITQADSNRQDEPARMPSAMPGHSSLCCNTFLPFYSKDWEHVLVTWFTATLKLLCLERMQQQGEFEPVDIEAKQTNGTDSPLMRDESPQPAVSELTTISTSSGADSPSVVIDDDASNDDPMQVERARNKAVWAMLYVSRLLTTIPELLPTQLDYTKELVESEFADAETDIKTVKRWAEKTRGEVASWPPPEPITFTNQLGISSRPHDVSGSAYRHHNHENDNGEFRLYDIFLCRGASRYVAVMLFDNLGPAGRWEVVASSACWFVAALAQSLKVVEHSTRLTKGGELLTTLWMLSSHLGGGEQ